MSVVTKVPFTPRFPPHCLNNPPRGSGRYSYRSDSHPYCADCYPLYSDTYPRSPDTPQAAQKRFFPAEKIRSFFFSTKWRGRKSARRAIFPSI